MTRTLRYSAGFIGGLAAVLLLAGCFQQLVVYPPLPTSGDMSAVRSDLPRFEPADSPASGVVAGAVIDEILNLAGCWGAADVFPNAAESGADLEDVEVWRFGFDGDNGGSVRWEVFQRDVAGYPRTYRVLTGRFQVLDAARLSIQFTTEQTASDGDDALRSRELAADDPLRADERVVTIIGDEMRIRQPSAINTQPAAREALVFRRFNCR